MVLIYLIEFFNNYYDAYINQSLIMIYCLFAMTKILILYLFISLTSGSLNKYKEGLVYEAVKQNPVNLTRAKAVNPVVIKKYHTSQRECHDAEDGHDQLLEILHKGLPKTKKKVKVVIVGAGISGLVAGTLLKNAGYSVAIMEASRRIGGRIYTIRDTGNGWHGEGGPMRFPKAHYFTQYLLNKYELQLTEFRLHEDDSRMSLNGQSFLKKDYHKKLKDKNFLKTYGVTDKDIALNISLDIDPFAKEGLDLYFKGKFREALSKFDHLSLRDVLEDHGFSNNAINLLLLGCGEESGGHKSLMYLFETLCIFNSKMEFNTLSLGVDLLPRTIYENELKKDVYFRAKVTKIVRDSKVMEVYIDCSGVDCPLIDSPIEADHVILTPLPPVIQKIKFEPRFDPIKESAIRKMTSGPAVKVFVEFQRPFWQDFDIIGGSSTTDLQSKNIIYPSYSFKSGVGLAIVAYNWNYDAMRMAGMTQDEIVTECLYALADVHNVTYKFVRSIYNKAEVIAWHLEPNFLGAWGYYEKYEVRKSYK